MALPIDVIISEILPKLPSKSLIRFKCVCKSFKSKISSFEFINSYLYPCLSSNPNRFLILPTDHDLLYWHNFDSQESPIITNPHFLLTFGVVSLISSCNGLFCISKGSRFILVNPSTGRFWEIPFVRLGLSLSAVNFGFGYDAAADDYKIVSFFDFNCDNRVKMRGIVVYSLKANSWRWVERGKLTTQECILWSNSIVLLGNDLLHCVFTSSSLQNRQSRIRCFDMGRETWRDDVMMPMYYDEHDYDMYDHEAGLHDIGVLDGCLCLTFENRRELNFDVWIMKEYGVHESWVRLFSISISSVPGNIYPIACRQGSKGEVLLRVISPTKFLCYNSSSDEIVDIRFKKVRDLSHLRACICIGSPGGDHIGTAIQHNS